MSSKVLPLLECQIVLTQSPSDLVPVDAYMKKYSYGKNTD